MTGSSIDERLVAARYGALRERIERAGGRDVTVIAVTKAFDVSAIHAATACGIGDIGENYAQECLAKLAQTHVDPLPRVHFIGRLQRNKVRRLAGHVDVWHTIDRVSLAKEVGRRAPSAQVMIQVNITGESQKGGCLIGDTDALVGAVSDAGLSLIGLMGIGQFGNLEANRDCFAWLRHKADSLGLQHCSMGMTGDLEVAVSEGATMIRVGTALFGKRHATRA